MARNFTTQTIRWTKGSGRGKRATEISTEKQFALVGEPKRKIYRKTGGNTMVRVMAANQVSINNPKTGKTALGSIHSVVRTPRTPTTFVETSSLRVPSSRPTKVVFASRPPWKNGVINGVLLE